ncbi:MAG TPA: glycosyltransferase family 2 protein [Candidatus Obscuribacterales bacterium]
MTSHEAEKGAIRQPLVSVVLPCLNEEKAIGICIEKIRKAFTDGNIDGEIVVCDNGSTDRSVEIAESMQVNVVHQPERGYGNAYLKGFSAASGKYFIMADADDTYDFALIPIFLAKLQEGFDFVTGSRYLDKGSANITWLHRYIGNPLLTMALNTLFGTPYTDVYCGYRAFSREAYEKIRPVSPGMEFNLELAINAHLAGLKYTEIAITLAPRIGESKLSTFRDGWRSLRMMLLYCPNKVFLVPGIVLSVLGVALHAIVLLGLVHHEGRQLGTITSIFATVFTVVGVETLLLGLHAKTYSWSRRFDAHQELLVKFYKVFHLESGLILGSSMVLGGVAIFGYLIYEWIKLDLMPLPHPEWASLGATLIIVGCSITFSSLFISAMSISKSGS